MPRAKSGWEAGGMPAVLRLTSFRDGSYMIRTIMVVMVAGIIVIIIIIISSSVVVVCVHNTCIHYIYIERERARERYCTERGRGALFICMHTLHILYIPLSLSLSLDKYKHIHV